MAPLACLPARETLELPFLRHKSKELWADMVDVVTTPTPWPDNNCADFMLSAIPLSSQKIGAEVEQEKPLGVVQLAFPWALETSIPNSYVNTDFPSDQYVYLSPQCVPLQHGLAQTCLAVEKPDSNQMSSFATTGDFACTTTTDGFNQNSLYATQGIEAPFSERRDDMVYGLLEQQSLFSSVCSTDSESSDLHASGQCKPCAWFWKKQGCHNGESCRYCHLCPQGELRSRKKARVGLLMSANGRKEN